MKQLYPGDICLVWEDSDLAKQVWFYHGNDNGFSVFVNKWPAIKSEGFISLSLSSLQYKKLINIKDM